ncbi:MAG: riboflavin synthase [Alphaproteobacteria bacterium]|jgi:riboflavin synthase|nr:riboflavin synthase [Alphaproteobacteria bacterium]MBT5828403.1 riboflavin synthase [Alphaproteobacteria bacterium]
MFTGIIENLGIITNIIEKGTEKEIIIAANIDETLKIGQSIACNGACLTITNINKKELSFFISAETIAKTTISNWSIGKEINLEQAMSANSRFDGHMVSGHIDDVAKVDSIKSLNDSYIVKVLISDNYVDYLIDKGSITIDGISLTINKIENNIIYLNIIPHTWLNTNMKELVDGDDVNIEIDLIAKYIKKLHVK